MSPGQEVAGTQENSQVKTWQAPVVEGPITGKHDISAKPPTAKQMQALQKDAYEEAFNQGRKEGLAKGYEEGLIKGEGKLNAEIQLFNTLLKQFALPLQNLDDEIENNIVALIIQIARHLVRREIKAEPGEIVAVVRESLGVLPVSARNPKIFLHPEDAVLVKNALSISDDDSNWRIEEDISLNRGDCRLKTESSPIDATIDARLSAVSAKLLGGERNTDSDT